MVLRDRVSLRRFAVMAALAVMVVGTFVVPVEAEAKKRTKPQSFKAEGTLLTANPMTLRRIGVTRNEFVESCAIPRTQGVDGYVIELPEAFKTITSQAYVTGIDVIGQPDLDMYYFNDACEEIAYTATADFSEYGMVPPGTTYVLVTEFLGGSSEFTFEAIEFRK